MFETLHASLTHNRRDVVMFIILMIIGLAIFQPMMMRWQTMGDYPVHNELALKLVNEPSEFFRNTPHFLYHLATALIFLLVPNIGIGAAGAWVMVLCYLALSMIIYWQIRQHSDLPPAIPVLLISGAFTLALLIIMPISFFTPENLYFGYFAPHVYHNPTVTIVKPFSLVLFFMALRLFLNKDVLSAWWILPYALMTFLSLVAKPSFILAFVPTLGLVTAAFIIWRIIVGIRESQSFLTILGRIMQRSYINWAVLILGIVLPTFAILFYQTLTWTSSGGIGIEPFRVFFEWTLHYEENADKQILYKFIMSSAFPLAVYLLHIKHSYRNLMFNLAWLLFIVSAAYAYLLVDYTIIAAGDFGWSAQVAILILHIVASIILFKQYRQVLIGEGISTPDRIRLVTCLVIFALHVVAGIHWYRLHMSQEVLDLLYIWW